MTKTEPRGTLEIELIERNNKGELRERTLRKRKPGEIKFINRTHREKL